MAVRYQVSDLLAVIALGVNLRPTEPVPEGNSRAALWNRSGGGSYPNFCISGRTRSLDREIKAAIAGPEFVHTDFHLIIAVAKLLVQSEDMQAGISYLTNNFVRSSKLGGRLTNQRGFACEIDVLAAMLALADRPPAGIGRIYREALNQAKRDEIEYGEAEAVVTRMILAKGMWDFYEQADDFDQLLAAAEEIELLEDMWPEDVNPFADNAARAYTTLLRHLKRGQRPKLEEVVKKRLKALGR